MIHDRIVVLGCLLLAILTTGCGDSGLGEVRVLQGSATIVSGEKTTTVNRGAKGVLHVGDTLSTGEETDAVVYTGKQTYLLTHDSEIRFELVSSEGYGARKVSVLKGLVNFWIPVADEKHYRFQVGTNHVGIGVKGTIFSVGHTDKGVAVSVYKGKVDLFKPDVETIGGLGPGGKSVRNPKQVPSPLASLDEGKRTVVGGGSAPGPVNPMSEDELAAAEKDLLSKPEKLDKSLY